jgi:large subunit ribosomal protein L4
MKMPIYTLDGKTAGETDLPEDIFGIQEINVGLMHQAYVRQMANARQANAHVRTRGEVSRTTAKWYRQKGTGRARHGSRSASQFVGGGKAHGPRNTKNPSLDMPRKMRQAALRHALSALVRDAQLVVVKDLTLSEQKTKVMAQALHTVTGTHKVLVLLLPEQEAEKRAIRNIDGATALNVNYLNIRDLFSHEKVVMSLAALESIRAHLSLSAKKEG